LFSAYCKRGIPMERATIIIVMIVLLTASLFAGEQLLCGFEEAEMASWISASNTTFYISTTLINNDSEKVYRCNSGVAGAIVSFHTRKSPANATEGEWTLFHPIYSSGAPTSVLIRSHADWFQNWNALSSGKYLDSNDVCGDFDGPIDYSVNRYCTIFGLFRLIDRLPAAIQDWSAYDYLYFDVKSTDAKVWLWVRYEGKYRPSNRCEYEIEAGQYYTVCVPIKRMAWLNDEDMTDIKDFTIQLRNVTGATHMYIDNLRLVTSDIAPIHPAIHPDKPILEPWLLTTQYKPPVAPPPAATVPARVTGAIAPAEPVLVTAYGGGMGEVDRLQNMRHGIVTMDNNRYAAIDEMRNYQYWASSYGSPSAPPAVYNSLQQHYRGRGWIGSIDGGATWQSDATAAAYPLQFSVYATITMRGTYVHWGFSDNMLRGYGYFGMMRWCQDYAPGSGFSSYITFFRLQPGAVRWEVYPHQTHATAVQYPDCIISSDMAKGCMGGLRMTVLPSGQIWSVLLSNHMNPTVSTYANFASYSDDGGIRWRFSEGKKHALWRAGQAEPLSGYSHDYITNFQGKVIVFAPNSGALYYTLGDKNGWSAWTRVTSNLGYDNPMTSAVTYKDSAIFASIYKSGSFFIKTAAKDTLTGAITGVNTRQQLVTLVGERIWYVWVDGKKIKCRKYFIPENRWTDSTVLVESDTTILDLRLPQVSPPSHVPVEWREYGSTSGSYNLKLARIPIDSEEAMLDPDYDGLHNNSETAYGTHPGNPDSDGDGLWDGQEACLLTTNPNDEDSDDDGDNDGVEVYAFSNPKDASSTATRNEAPAINVRDSIVGNVVFLDASATTDAENDFLRYFWYFDLGGGDTAKAEGSRIVYSCESPAPYAAKLIVDDGRGNKVEQLLSLFMKNEKGTTQTRSSGFFGVEPNPFNPSTNIRFGLAGTHTVWIGVYDINGRLVNRLVDKKMTKGEHSVLWNGRDMENLSMGSGIYIVKMVIGNEEMIRSVILLK